MIVSNKRSLPLIPVRGTVIFPNMITSFPLGREKSIAAIRKASSKYNSKVLLAAQRDMAVTEPGAEDIYKVGVIATVRQTIMMPGNITHIIVEGKKRAVINAVSDDGECLVADVEELPQDTAVDYGNEVYAFMRIVTDEFISYGKLVKTISISQEQTTEAVNATKPGKLSDIIGSALAVPLENKQQLLEIFDPVERLEKVHESLSKEIEILTIKKELEKKVKKNMEKAQRDYFLREELKVIHEELGDKDEVQDEIDKYMETLNGKELPQRVHDVLDKEIRRLSRIPVTAPEANVARNYIEYMLGIPWTEKTEDNNDLINAEKILDEDHYGLKKVKERIIEYLAVRMNTGETNSTILCLVGPPGVGKTSIAKSVARALGRNYVRMSLGGMKDESEIRGHRKTYVSAMPGRIISAMRQAGTINPLMLLDEVDKLASSYQGDPAAALLEVLDSEQNSTFRDNYIEIEYDLSNVFFICTANDISTVPSALRDRMEIIELSSYTAEEKKQIAIRHLIPKQLKENGLAKSRFKITDEAIEKIISGYCKEAGVRKLERTIGKLCRMTVKQLLTGERKSVRITDKNIDKYLGSPKYRNDVKAEDPAVGVVRGLAWTQVGGETLVIEANVMSGSGNLQLTGNMGNVMKESAMAALSYIRSMADKLGIANDFYKENDISIHIPEGAVPKDGPSAGITMTTAMVSALTDKPVRNDVAMTGEVTIRGRILPIGGLNEKVLAAKKAGIMNIILPEANNTDILEMPREIKEDMNFIFVREMSQVLENAFFGGW